MKSDVQTPTTRRNTHTHSVSVAVQSLREFILHGAVEVPLTPENGLSSPYAAHFVLPSTSSKDL